MRRFERRVAFFGDGQLASLVKATSLQQGEAKKTSQFIW